MKWHRSGPALQRYRRSERWRRWTVTGPLVDLDLTAEDLLQDLDPGIAGPWADQ